MFTSPFANFYLHFNRKQKEFISAAQVVKRLKQHNIVLAAVLPIPKNLVLELADEGSLWLQAFFSRYITARRRDRWYLDESVMLEAERRLSSRHYSGKGELHIPANFGPRRDNSMLAGL